MDIKVSNGSHFTAGDGEIAIAGGQGSVAVGDGGTAIAGKNGRAEAGAFGRAVVGDYGLAIAGPHGRATAGDGGTAIARAYGIAIVKGWATAIAGPYGTAIALSEEGVVSAGERGTARILYRDAEGRQRVAVGRALAGILAPAGDVIESDGGFTVIALVPNTFYKVNLEGQFIALPDWRPIRRE